MLFVLLIVVSILFRYFSADNETVLYFHTLSSLSDLATGALAAWCIQSESFAGFFKNMKKLSIIGIYLVGITMLVNLKTLFVGDWLIALERFPVAVFYSFVVLEQNYAEHSFFKMKSFGFFSYWGKYTYGLCCLHLIALLFVSFIFRSVRSEESVFTLALQSVLALLVSMAVSWVSYHCFEKHFLRLKKSFS